MRNMEGCTKIPNWPPTQKAIYLNIQNIARVAGGNGSSKLPSVITQLSCQNLLEGMQPITKFMGLKLQDFK